MISIVIPNYNGFKFLECCMDSLEKQTLRAEEIIVVDNNSSDQSLEFIKKSYPKVKIISLDQNYGFSKAVNEGIKASSNPFIVLLNNDVEAHPQWLENLYDCICKDETAFSCSSKMIRFHQRDKIDDAGDGYTLLGWAVKHGDGKSYTKYDMDREIFSSCGGAAIYRKKIFEEIGYFDEIFFAYLEDLDISYRARINGYKNIFASKAIIYHKGSATSGSRHNVFKTKLVPRNNILLIYKNMPMLQLLINLPFILIGYLIKVLFFYSKSLGNEYIKGIVSGFKMIPKVQKVKFKKSNIKNYFIIQCFLIKDTLGLVKK